MAQWSDVLCNFERERSETTVHFVKTYDGGKPHARPISYEGSVNGDATKIDGRWKIPANWSGKFQMIRSRAPAEAEEVPQAESPPKLETEVVI